MNLEKIKNIHFIGIGGIGMSALARYFNFLGKNISGYDRTSSDLTKEMESEGMKIYYEENIALLPSCFIDSPSSEENLIIYTPAVPSGHAEILYFRKHNVALFKRAEILGEISKQLPTIAIGGTHGKTTTTSMLTYICLTSDMEFISFVGGINENFNSNLVIQGKPAFIITEADEYDRSFLKLSPRNIILTSMDPDHLDIYSTKEKMEESFREFISLADDNGLVLINQKLENRIKNKKFKTYGSESAADYHPVNVRFESGFFHFDFIGPEIKMKDLKLGLPGYHNLENATAAIAMALHLSASENSIRKALENYRGVKRRFEYHINNNKFIYIDDYAHHPEEINAVINSLRKMYPGKKITGVFQPHLYSRTRDLAEGFARCLEKVDELILLEIYPARELPMPGITSLWLLDQINLDNKKCTDKSHLLNELKKIKTDILVTLGAGDIDQMVHPIKELFSNE